MKERIQKFIDYKSISPGTLAEMLGVQRSNISHILNGRNKPGAVFIEKFLLSFPMLNARWLFTGQGPMVTDMAQQEYETAANAHGPAKEPSVSPEKPVSAAGISYPDATDRTIEKVVLLYSDGTFTTFDPF